MTEGQNRVGQQKGVKMQERAKVNAMRSGVVVLGALAFGYLTLQLGFKPFLEKAAAAAEAEARAQEQQQLALEQPKQERNT